MSWTLADLNKEIDAMKAIAEYLDGLDEEQVKRVVKWIIEVYQVEL